MKQSRNCHTCQRNTFNLMSANCGHKICFNCVKSNKNTHKCAQCMTNRMKTPPKKIDGEGRERSTKVKQTQSKTYNQLSPMGGMDLNRPSHHKSSMCHYDGEQIEPVNILSSIPCKQHNQPISLYCKTSKQLLCSVCLIKRSKNPDILPLRQAEQHLRKQNKQNTQQTKNILSTILNAKKIIETNINLFNQSCSNARTKLQQHFIQLNTQLQTLQTHSYAQLSNYIEQKVKQCQQIHNDLQYLTQILKQFKDNSKNHSSQLQEQIYLFTSFKVIRNTIKQLNLDYLPYTKPPKLLKIDNSGLSVFLNNSVQLKLDLPLKFVQPRSRSKQQKRSVGKVAAVNQNQPKRQSFTSFVGASPNQRGNKKHQISLCNNQYGIQLGQQQRNLYKQLLKTRFKL